MKPEEDADSLGDSPDELAVRNAQADILRKVHAEEYRPLLGATRADASLLAGKGDEELVAAVRAADAGEAFTEVAALQELADCLVDDRPPEADSAGESLRVDRAEVVEIRTK